MTAAQYQDSRTYDAMGRITTHGPNLLANGGPDNYQYGTAPAPVHGVGSVVYYPRGSTAFRYSAAYDAAGNMICRDQLGGNCAGGANNGAQLAYDAAGRLSAWQNAPISPSATASFLYDAEGKSG